MTNALTIEEAASKLGKSVATVRKWISDGRLKFAKKLGRIQIDPVEIDRVKDLTEVPSPAEREAPSPARRRKR